ncbi:MAG: glycerophosphodiester phosphodiesterase [Caldilineaceae bacterium]|nr:glycerophosphodiester phosphodiesterase [Caldilineaceae bacterium]
MMGRDDEAKRRGGRGGWLLGAIVGAPLLFYGVASLLARPAAERPVFERLTARPLVIAHRGGAGLWPANTLFAFEKSAELGVDMLEMDVHASADGVLVVRHDDTVDSTTNGQGEVRTKTLAELKALDAGYRWTDDDGATFPFRGQGITIPTLEEVFAALPDMPMTIEIKQADPSITQPLCDLIRRYNKTDQVIVGSFHNHALDDFRRICPEVATSGHEGDVRAFVYLSLARLGNLYSPRAEALQVPRRSGNIEIVTSHTVRSAHNRGLNVQVWTINEKDEMQDLIEIGVDGIITDRPDRLLELLGR